MSCEIEKVWTTETGHKACVLWVNDSHRCGYVAVDPKNGLHGKEYSHKLPSEFREKLQGQEVGKRGPIALLGLMVDEDGVRLDAYFDVHGGLTYSRDGGEGYPAPAENAWWFGYDCAHSGDRTQYSTEGIERSLEYCVAECESLSRQLKEFEE